MYVRRLFPILLACLTAGCATTRTSDTARTAMEQMLISNAVDQAIDRTSFDHVAGRRVFVEEKYLDCVDKPYVVGTLRHRVLEAGGMLAASADDADVVMEIRSGGVGTDNSDKFVGIPGIALPGPMPLEIPEVRFWEKTSQYGTAKLAIATYDTKSRAPLSAGQTQLARSDNSHWSILGLGPGATGTVHQELRSIPEQSTLPSVVAGRNSSTRTADGGRSTRR